jgi:glycosyltransferase involved in cell wall biosynthesis/ribosomal protein S18 acetylase RimI-like enzyme
VTTGDAFRVAHLTTVDMTLALVLLPQLEALRDAGADVIGVSSPGPWVADLTDRGIRHVALPASTRGMHPIADLRAAAQLGRVLRAERPMILHTHTPKPGVYGRVVGRLAGVPVVVNTVHGMYATEDDPWPKRAVVYALEAIASRFSDAELMINPEDVAVSRRWRLARPERVRLVGHGVDLSRFDATRLGAARDRVRVELGVGDDVVVIGAVGRLVAEKGFPELFEAVASLPAGRQVLVVVGPEDPAKPDALTPELISRTTEAGVRFLGSRPDVERLYAAMDVFALPSHREGMPQAGMEAAAMGLPIVAADVRGSRQVVDDGRTGILVPARDPERLAAALKGLIDDADLRRAMGRAGSRKARREFDQDAVIGRVIDVYRDVAVRKGLGHRLPAGLRGVHPPAEVRSARASEAPALARLHAENIIEGFLPRLGQRFLTLLYRSLIAWDDAVVLVAADAAGPAAFVAGVVDVKAFYRHFARRCGLRAAVAAMPRLLRPANLRRAFEVMRYADDRVSVPAELLSMAVSPSARRRGLGTRLGGEFLEALRRRRVERVEVVVGEGNEAALAAYRKMGFVVAGSTEVHAGERSTVLTWQG